MRITRKYTEEEKLQIIEEVKNSGSISTVSKKRGIPAATIHSWTKPKSTKNEKINVADIELKKKLADVELENKILKDLLKKTYQVWPTD